MTYNKKKGVVTIKLKLNIKDIRKDILAYDPSIDPKDLEAWTRDSISDILTDYFQDGVAGDMANEIMDLVIVS